MCHIIFIFFFFNDTATTEIYTLSLHDALPICGQMKGCSQPSTALTEDNVSLTARQGNVVETRLQEGRSEEHTSELQSQSNLVCRLLLEKKKKKKRNDSKTMIQPICYERK